MNRTIDARTIDARTIDARTIDARTIDARTIDAMYCFMFHFDLIVRDLLDGKDP